jgi:hypothetical protein
MITIDKPRAALINFKDKSEYPYKYAEFFMLGHCRA